MVTDASRSRLEEDIKELEDSKQKDEKRYK